MFYSILDVLQNNFLFCFPTVTVSYDSYYQYPPVVHLTLLKTVQAHQQPINTIQANEAQLITASQDYTLKVRLIFEES